MDHCFYHCFLVDSSGILVVINPSKAFHTSYSLVVALGESTVVREEGGAPENLGMLTQMPGWRIFAEYPRVFSVAFEGMVSDGY